MKECIQRIHSKTPQLSGTRVPCNYHIYICVVKFNQMIEAIKTRPTLNDFNLIMFCVQVFRSRNECARRANTHAPKIESQHEIIIYLFSFAYICFPFEYEIYHTCVLTHAPRALATNIKTTHMNQRTNKQRTKQTNGHRSL